jgi:hypothetical protein
MKSLTTLLVVATLLLCSGYALAGDIKIIANSNVNAT